MNWFIQLLGAGMIMTGSMGIAYCRTRRFDLRFRVVSESERVFHKLRQKILYQRVPVDRLIGELAEEMSGEWKNFFEGLTINCSKELEADFQDALSDYMDLFCRKYRISEEKFLLQGIRTILLSYDATEVEAELQLLMEEQKIRKQQLMQKSGEVKKLSFTLGFALGATGILILL